MENDQQSPQAIEPKAIRHRSFKKKLTRKNTLPKNATELRKAKFVDGLLDGLSMTQAALKAGYSPVTSRQACTDIMPRCRELFQQALRERISIGGLADRIKEGLDAEETKFFAKDGIVTDQRNVKHWGERRQYADLAARLMGYEPDKPSVNINAAGQFQVVTVMSPIEDSEE